MTFSKLGTDLQTGQVVELPKSSRPQGLYIIGIQGTGKSGLIENLIMQDIRQQIGVCVLDPHGELIEHVLARLPDKQTEEKVILLDIEDEDYPFGLNLFTCSNPKSAVAVQYVVDQIMHVFDKLLGVSHDTPLILQYLRNCTYTLLANPGYTMADIPLLLTDRNCRQQLVANVQRMQTRLFWQQYDQMKPGEQIEQMASIQRRVDDFLQDLILPIVGQSRTTIDLQKIMDEGKIMLVKLSPQLDSVSSLIGSLFIALLLNAAYARPTNKRRQFHLYADEFERFATEDFATLLEQARKFGIATTIAHQNRGQLNSANGKLETDLKDRSRSVGNMVVFRVNSKDADDLAGEFQISPEAAYEEELEEEWLEIREQERLEMMEVIDGEEYSDTPVKDVVGHLLRGGSHPDPVVNEFTHQVLSLLNLGIEMADNAYLSEFNRLFYDAMIGKQVPMPSLQFFTYIGGKLGATDYVNCLYDVPDHMKRSDGFSRGLTHALRRYRHWDSHAARQALAMLWNNDYNTSEAEAVFDKEVYERLKEYHLGKLQYELEEIGRRWENYHGLLESKIYDTLTFSPLSKFQRSYDFSAIQDFPYKNPYEWVANLKPYWHPHYPEETWYHIDLDRLEWEQTTIESEVRTEPRTGEEIISVALHNRGYRSFRLIEGQEDKFYHKADLERVVEEESQTQREIFLGFIHDLKVVMQALADEPIYASSGIKQPRKRQQILLHPEKTFAHPRKAITHPQRPYADIRNEIANELSSLPNFTARVRMTVEGQTVEHTITTLAPEKGVYGKLLQERIARIQAQNRRDGYTKARAGIEAEITQRQTRCSGESALAQLAQPSPQPQPRHARQVPVQGKCRNCGASNTPGAQFCNQCGTKL